VRLVARFARPDRGRDAAFWSVIRCAPSTWRSGAGRDDYPVRITPCESVGAARVIGNVIRGGDVLGMAEPGGVLADFDFALASEDAGEVAMVTYGRALYDWTAAAPAFFSR
jgi:hypothetical protein